jgi:hypothetical protein
MTEYKSPITGKTYNITDVSPLILSMLLSNDTENAESSQVRLKLANLGITTREYNEKLAKPDTTQEQKAEITASIVSIVKESEALQFKLMSLIRVKPASMCEVLRSFVQELEGKSDSEILRLGKDFDLLFVQVQTNADKDSDKYNEAMKAK